MESHHAPVDHLARHEACDGVLTSMGAVVWCARCGEEWEEKLEYVPSVPSLWLLPIR